MENPWDGRPGLPSDDPDMIAMPTVLATAPRLPSPRPPGRRAVLSLGLACALAGCTGGLPGPAERPDVTRVAQDGTFRMRDGAALPFRRWLPKGAWADVMSGVVLALHGFNDSRDAWEIPAGDFVTSGFGVYAPDQRGFGATDARGHWPGTATLVDDAADAAMQVQALHPGVPLIVMGESMGGAVTMCLAASPQAPVGGRYVLIAPAVWGRAEMNVFLRSSLWLAAGLLPSMAVTGGPVRVKASDNRAALIRLSRDPLTIHRTRFDTLRGLVDLMDAAKTAAPAIRAPALFLYGAHDQLVPKTATLAMWRSLHDPAAVLAYYPDAYHLMLRDLTRAEPIDDVLAWLHHPAAPLPSGADRRAAHWLATARS
jgi:acylglycerol lipase